jgi:hypothetical protein
MVPMGLKDRLDKLRGEAAFQRTTLVCPQCGEEFVCYGDVALEVLVEEYVRGSPDQGYREAPEDIRRLFDHEHAVGAFVDKASGLPFLSREVSGVNLLTPPERDPERSTDGA